MVELAAMAFVEPIAPRRNCLDVFDELNDHASFLIRDSVEAVFFEPMGCDVIISAARGRVDLGYSHAMSPADEERAAYGDPIVKSDPIALKPRPCGLAGLDREVAHSFATAAATAVAVASEIITATRARA